MGEFAKHGWLDERVAVTITEKRWRVPDAYVRAFEGE
jgi:hypothetical protein